MKKFSLYKNLTTNQIKMAIFMIGFLLIAIPGIAEAKLITVGTASDTVNFGNRVGIGTTAPSDYLSINVPTASSTGITFKEADSTTYGARIYYKESWDTLYMNMINNSSEVSGLSMARTSGNVGIGSGTVGVKLDVFGAFRNSLATTHSLLGGAGNAVVMTDNTGSLFSMDPTTFAANAASVSTLYHIKQWFVPQTGQTISSSGTTVTMLNPVSSYQFSSSMVGSKLTISGESRVITAYTSTSVVTVDSAYSTNYSGVSNTLWGVYSKAVEIAADGSISTYSEVGGMAIKKRSGDTNTYIPALLDYNNKYYLPSTILYLNKDFPIKWSASTSYSSATNDVGLRRSAAGALEIYDGTGTTPGTVADYRDLNIRSLNPNGENIGIGTTTPSNNKLTVVSDQSGGGVIKVQNTNYNSWSSYEMFDYAGVHKTSFGYANPGAPTVAGLAHFSTSDDTPFIIAIHDLEKIRVTTNGYIGIGTTNPTDLLHIATSTDTYLNVNSTSNSIAGIKLQRGALQSDSWTDYSIYDSLGNLFFDQLANGGANTRLFIQDNSGNIGIGVTAPNAPLSFSGGSGGQKILLYDRSNLRHGLGIDMNDGWETDLFAATDGSSGHISFGFVSNSDGVSYTERARLDALGNLGIGVQAPSSMLDIYSNYASQGFRLSADRDDAGGIIFQAYDRDSVTRGLVLTDENRVGVGTSTPSATLDIYNNGDSTRQGFRLSGERDDNGLLFQVFDRDNPNGGLSVTGIAGGVNVGIGKTNPAAKLDVAGTTKLGTTGGAFTAMGTCTIAASTITTTKVNKTCTGIPASTAVAVSCTGSAAFSGISTIYCRATGTADQLACNTIAANTTSMTYTCMWIQP